MRRVARAVLEHKGIMLALYAALSVVSVALMLLVKVNYNLVDYLPADAPSTAAYSLLVEEYGGAMPNMNVYVPELSVVEALDMKETIAAQPGISSVIWLDDTADVRDPLVMADESLTSSWYKNGGALYMVTVDAEDVVASVHAVREAIGESGAVSGAAVNSAAAQETTGDEMPKIMMLAVPLVLFVLLATTSSWFEPVLFLLTIGISILLNEGSNYFIGEISFVTQACSAVLQLAVSMDYAVFLLHSFQRYREKGLEVKEAMIEAMTESAPAVLSSALTTVFGFLALCLMKFELGVNLGVVLAKGITFSLLSVIFLLPVMAVYTAKLMDKTSHRPLLPKFERFSRFVMRVCFPVMAVVLILVGPCFIAQGKTKFVYGASGMNAPGSKADLDIKLINETFGELQQLVVIVPRGRAADEKALGEALMEIPEITAVISYAETVGNEVPNQFLSESQKANFIAGDWTRLILTAATPDEGDAAFRVVEEVRGVAERFYPGEYYAVGNSVNHYDLMDIITGDSAAVNLAATAAIYIILIITFKGLALPTILILTIKTAIWVNLALPYFMDWTLNYIGYLIINSVQLGATVDYGILFSQRYYTNRRLSGRREAIRLTVRETAPSILTPAAILTIAGTSLKIISSNGVISQLGEVLGRGAAISAAMVLLFLPALLLCFDRLIMGEQAFVEKQLAKRKERQRCGPDRGKVQSVSAQKCVLQRKITCKGAFRMERVNCYIQKMRRALKSLATRAGLTGALLKGLACRGGSLGARLQGLACRAGGMLADCLSTGIAAARRFAGRLISALGSPRRLARRVTALLLAASALALLLPSGFSVAQPKNTLKEEVVYANLSAEGAVEGIFVVNSFNLESAGEIVDYGSYDESLNLTTTDPLSFSDDRLTLSTGAGRFSYQGNLSPSTPLPWRVEVGYFLNDSAVSPEALGGSSGHLTIKIELTENKRAPEGFFDGLAVQLSLTLPNAVAKNVVAEGATIASAGGSRTVAFTLLPGNEASYRLECDVDDFYMGSIQMACVPLSMALDFGDLLDSFTTQLSDLENGVALLDDGTSQLADGVRQLAEGTALLADYGAELGDGARQLGEATHAISDGVEQMTVSMIEFLNSALTPYADQLKELGLPAEVTRDNYREIIGALQALAERLSGNEADERAIAGQTAAETLSGNAALKAYIVYNRDALLADGYSAETLDTWVAAIDALEAEQQAFATAPAENAPKVPEMPEVEAESGVVEPPETGGGQTEPEQMSEPEQSAEPEPGQSAESVQRDYELAPAGVGPVAVALPLAAGASESTVGFLSAPRAESRMAEVSSKSVMSDQQLVAEARSAMTARLSETYFNAIHVAASENLELTVQMLDAVGDLLEFTESLQQYLDGVNQFVDGVAEYTDGVIEMNDGVSELRDGSDQLADGMGQFRSGTDGIGQKVSDGVDDMMSEFLPEFEPKSFVSGRNTEVSSVQFVLQTAAIARPPKTVEEQPVESTTLWQRVLAIFGVN